MEWLIAVVLLAFLGYLVFDETLGEAPMLVPRKRLCDYYVAGSVYEDVPTALARGVRLLEVHLYSDERDQPVVGLKAQNEGYDYAEESVSFEQVCIDITNDAFPSEDPFVLSIVPHTTKTVTLNKAAEHIMTTMRRRLLKTEREINTVKLDALKDKVIIVSGGTINGSDLEPLVNLSWNGSNLRRLSYQQALHPRDPQDLLRFNKDRITLVAPETELKTVNANPDRPKALGCQWNLFDKTGKGFVEKTLVR
jgi:hypothetical protein